MSIANEGMDAKVVEDVIVAPGQPWGRKVLAGQHLKIIDTAGKQAVDFLCYDADDPSDRYNASNTMKMNRSIVLTKGSVIWSDRAKKMMTVIEDTCGGHDTIGGCCSSEMNLVRYGKTPQANCRDTFEAALKQFNLTRGDIATNINWFMNVPVGQDGSMGISEGYSKPGDFVSLRAERDLICVVSNCAQIYNPCNGFDPTPVRIVTLQP